MESERCNTECKRGRKGQRESERASERERDATPSVREEEKNRGRASERASERERERIRDTDIHKENPTFKERMRMRKRGTTKRDRETSTVREIVSRS